MSQRAGTRSLQTEVAVTYVPKGPMTSEVAGKLAELLTDALHEDDQENATSKLDEARRLLRSLLGSKLS